MQMMQAGTTLGRSTALKQHDHEDAVQFYFNDSPSINFGLIGLFVRLTDRPIYSEKGNL